VRTTWAIRIAQGGLPRTVVEKAVLKAIREARRYLRQRGASGRRWTLRWKVIRGGLQRWRSGRAHVLATLCGACRGAFLVLPWITPEDVRRSDSLATQIPPLAYLAMWNARGEGFPRGWEDLCRECLAVEFHTSIRVGSAKVGTGLSRRRRKVA
jgi:hypothetical protein